MFYPAYIQAYGCIFQINRNGQRADPVSVLVDQWPEFSVLLIKPEFQEVSRILRNIKALSNVSPLFMRGSTIYYVLLQKADFFKDVTVFSKNDVCLKDLLAHTDVIDWKMFICLGTCMSLL